MATFTTSSSDLQQRKDHARIKFLRQLVKAYQGQGKFTEAMDVQALLQPLVDEYHDKYSSNSL